MLKEKIKRVENRIDDLLNAFQENKQQNKELRKREARLSEERQSLIHKNKLARNKVNTMISRLKALEQDA